jgi:hypothetical protein
MEAAEGDELPACRLKELRSKNGPPTSLFSSHSRKRLPETVKPPPPIRESGGFIGFSPSFGGNSTKFFHDHVFHAELLLVWLSSAAGAAYFPDNPTFVAAPFGSDLVPE